MQVDFELRRVILALTNYVNLITCALDNSETSELRHPSLVVSDRVIGVRSKPRIIW